MDILLVEKDRLIRDQVKVGLQQFPDFTVTCGEGYAALNELRQRQFDAIFLGVDRNRNDGPKMLEHLRSIDPTTDVVVITDDRTAKEWSKEKGRLRIVSFLTVPLIAAEFFRLLGRMRERHLEAAEKV